MRNQGMFVSLISAMGGFPLFVNSLSNPRLAPLHGPDI